MSSSALLSHLAFMRLLPSVDQVVFLQVSQLSEAFVTGLTFERSLSAVDTKMNLHDEEEERKNLLRHIQIYRNHQTKRLSNKTILS